MLENVVENGERTVERANYSCVCQTRAIYALLRPLICLIEATPHCLIAPTSNTLYIQITMAFD